MAIFNKTSSRRNLLGNFRRGQRCKASPPDNAIWTLLKSKGTCSLQAGNVQLSCANNVTLSLHIFVFYAQKHTLLDRVQEVEIWKPKIKVITFKNLLA